MPNRTAPDPDALQRGLDEALARSRRPRGLATALRGLRSLRAQHDGASEAIDTALLTAAREAHAALEDERERHGAALREIEAVHAEMRQQIEQLTAPPWRIGRVAGVIEAGGARRVAVHLGGGLQVLAAPEEIGPLDVGDSVTVSHSGNLVMGPAPAGLADVGETAVFERGLPDGRVLLRQRDETMVYRVAGGLDVGGWRAGDVVRCDPRIQLALEVLGDPDAGRYVADVDRREDADRVGGHEAILERLVFALTGALVSPERAARYGYGRRRTVLLHGPPGCGKTLMVRVAVAALERRAGTACRLFVVKPGEWESPWVGETQASIRRTFARVREAAAEGPVVLYLDEIEAAGAHRGGPVARIADKFTSALLVELDGFTRLDRVAIVSSTNRKDLIDAPLLDRLSDVDLAVPRPDAGAARRIFEIHLGDELPMRPNGPSAASTRAAVIDRAVARLFASGGEGVVATLVMRDGRRRAVRTAELVSGRLIEQIARATAERAFMREVAGGPSGVCVDDVDAACRAAVDRLAGTLRPGNAHFYLADLADDAGVARIERPTPRVDRALAYVDGAPLAPAPGRP